MTTVTLTKAKSSLLINTLKIGKKSENKKEKFMNKILLSAFFIFNLIGCSHKVYRDVGENTDKEHAWFIERKIDHGWIFNSVSDDEKILYCKSYDKEGKKKPKPRCFRAQVY